MAFEHRIAAGGITFRNNRVLLVRYKEKGSKETYLVCPGGGLHEDENIILAIKRETMEETGIIVEPQRVVIIEDLLSNNYNNNSTITKMIKIWMICRYIEGEIRKTAESEVEGINEVGWFSRDQIINERVYPKALKEFDWENIINNSWNIQILPTRKI